MTDEEVPESEARLEVSNIGGIDHSSITFEPGLTILTGENATNRTSTLLALNEVLGGSMGSIRSGSERGTVSLEIGDKEYTRTLRSNGQDRAGEPYSKKTELVNTYASLLQRNEIRTLVESAGIPESDEGASSLRDINSQLGELLMRPVDDDEIREEKRELDDERSDLRDELREIENAKERLPQLEQELNEKQSRLEELNDQIEEKREQREQFDVEREETERAEELLAELESKQDDYSELEQKIEATKSRITELEETIEEKEEELEEIKAEIEEAEPPTEEEVKEMRRRRNNLDEVITMLEEVETTNRNLLDGRVPTELVASDDITDELAPTSERDLECPSCGNDVDRSQLEDRMAQLRDIADSYREERDEIKSELEGREGRRQKVRNLRTKRDSIQNEIDHKRDNLSDAEQDLVVQRENLEDLEEEIEELKTKVEETEEIRGHEIVEIREELQELTSKRTMLEEEIDNTEDEIEDLEETVEKEDEVREEIEEYDEKIAELNRTLERIETRVKDTLNEHMDELIDVLDYENIARVRIERQPSDVTGEISDFSLHIARETNGGVREEREISTLSESERSLVGVVLALAGYIAHDVHEEVPIVLVDSVEQFDSERINRLLQYVSDEIGVPYLVAALLPEDAGAITTEHKSITADALAS